MILICPRCKKEVQVSCFTSYDGIRQIPYSTLPLIVKEGVCYSCRQVA